MEVKLGAHGLPFIVLDQGERVHGCRPSVDVLFRSLANTFGENSAGLVLTGMGADGLDGAAAIVSAGGVVNAASFTKAPNNQVAQAVSNALFSLQYKPALCDGTPCAMPFPLRFYFKPGM